MKASLAVSLGAAALLGGVIYFEEHRINDLQLQIEGHRKNAATLLGRVSQLRTEAEDLDRRLKDAKALIEQLQGKLGKGDVTTAESASSASQSKSDESSGAKWMKGIAKMFTDPEMRKTMRAQQSMGIRMMYADLAKELGLSPQETEQLLELLTDRQMEMTAAGMQSFDKEKQNPADEERIAENAKRYEEQIKAILGDDKFAQLKTYEGSIGDRFMLQQFEGQFGTAGAPLEGDQKQKLLDLMREERKNTPSTFANTTDPSKQMEALRSPDSINQFVTGQEEFQKRVLERSRQFLNADQIGALEKVHQQQLEMLKMQMKMSREMFGVGK